VPPVLADSLNTSVDVSQLRRHYSIVWIFDPRKTTHVPVVCLQGLGSFAGIADGGGVVGYDFVGERSNIDASEAESLLEGLYGKVTILPQP